MPDPTSTVAGDGAAAPSAPVACNACRRSKLKCSKEQPTCEHCRRASLVCEYENKRFKPGVKVGAVDNLHRRIDNLEQALQDRSPSLVNADAVADSILSALSRDLPRLIGTPKSVSAWEPTSPAREETHQRKRRRLEDDGRTPVSTDIVEGLLANGSFEPVIDAYFCHVHPWIPMVHQGNFRQQLQRSTKSTKPNVLCRAMLLAAYRFVPRQLGVDMDVAGNLEQLRSDTVATAMDGLRLENLQSLIIIAFNDIGNGNASRAWSLVASLTRTVEYCKLTMEPDTGDRQSLCQAFTPLEAVEDWTAQETRRRVFWNVFNLDRFCSSMMGWNTSLTSDDVHRRLPCDGIHWRKHEQVATPYLGIWDKSAGRIGNPIVNSTVSLPSSYPAVDQSGTDTQSEAAPSPADPATSDMSRAGAFAYSVEATESMSRVTTYFLQQKINIHDKSEINSWLTRFKELDLRLVHWKMLLPQKWKSTNLTRQSTRMDPNLTLAHLTHNASMILLHQLIAYPPPNWTFRKRLPSGCSQETCCSAAVEIAAIAQNYLKFTPEPMPVASQVAFCAYIAARILLVDWRSDMDNQLVGEFWTLVKSLEDMSNRWHGAKDLWNNQHHDLSAKYAAKLRMLYEQCCKDHAFRLDVTGYSNEIDQQSSETIYAREFDDYPVTGLSQGQQMNEGGVNTVAPTSYTAQQASAAWSSYPPDPSPVLLDQHFMDMDRIIAFEGNGGMFTGSYQSEW